MGDYEYRDGDWRGDCFSPGAGRFDGIVGIFALIGDWLPGNVSVSAVVLLIRWQNHQNVKITRASSAVI